MVGYRQQEIEDRYDVIVIGSGAGGLAAAVLLSKWGGRRVLVLERHYVAGGFTQSFHRPGFDWDVGVHYIGLGDESHHVGRLFDGLTEGCLEWSDLPGIYDKVFIGEMSYDFWTGRERFSQTMKAYFPGEDTAIDQYLSVLYKCTDAAPRYFSERAMPAFVSALLGGMLRRRFLRYARFTTAQVLSGLIRNRELAAVLTGQWGCYGLPPGQSSFAIHASTARHYLNGGSYPQGGASRIAAAMTRMIERNGGAVVLCAEVAQILIDAGSRAVGVRMKDGREIRAACVVSDAGFANTFGRLLPPHVPGVDVLLRRVGAIPPSLAHVCLYLGLEGGASKLGLTGTNFWINPGPDHDGNLQRYLSDASAPIPFIMISSGSAKDPEFESRHPGHSTAEVLTVAPYDWFRRWENTRWKKRGEDYEDYKAAMTDRLLKTFFHYVPAARGCVLHSELSTPLSTRDCVGHPHGEMYGLAHTPRRFELDCLGPRTPVRGLYLAGQDACTCGVTGAVFGGILAASAILRRNLLASLLAT